MKKFLALLLSVALVLTVLSPIGVLAADDVVSIEFCVGDDTLIINGDAVKVEKPYVVGDGVTLVSLRVITEAFGATVEWVESTQSVNLTYPDVNIHLQINNPVAEVNKKAETLLSAPELTESGYTMVPLRFISENFGATVSYDEETERITVVKDNTGSSAGLIEGAVTSKKVGDSYYKWSIENSADIKMDIRSFDGTYTSFTYDENNYFDIEIIGLPENYNFEKEFVNAKATLQGYTLVKADKDSTDSGKKTMHFQAKDKKEFLDIRIFATPKYLITLFGVFENEKSETRDECIRIMSTFDCVFDATETYDLSNVVDGMRTFEAENINLSFAVPGDYFMTSSEDAENEFWFASLDDSDYDSRIVVCVYSKQDVGSAEKLSATDFENNQKSINEEVAKFSTEIASKQYKNFNAYEYSYTVDGYSQKFMSRDVFFELGDYVYNASVTLKTPHENPENVMYKVINSISPEEIDSEKVGMLMRNVIDGTGTYEAKLGEGTINIPNHYEEQANNEGEAYLSMKNGVAIATTVIGEGKVTFADLVDQCEKIEKTEKESKEVTIISPTDVVVLGKNRVISLAFSKIEGESLIYIEQYAVMKKGVGYVFAVIYPEISYSKSARDEVKEMVASLSFD